MNTLAEGVESLRLACNLVLVIPAAAIVLLGPRRRHLVLVWVGSVAAIGWLRFAGALDALPGAVAFAVGPLVVAAVVAASTTVRRAGTVIDRQSPHVIDAIIVVGAAFVSVWAWVPCVGPRLGDIANHARAEPWAQLWPTARWFVGLFLPVIVATAAATAWPAVGDALDRRGTRTIGLAVVGVVGALASLGWYDDLAGTLARASTW